MKGKQQKKEESSIPWKDFEDLVGKIEHMLVPQNCKVKPNDHIRDSTGELRQVDASVRIDNGTVEILYIIECRKRKKISDVTWVEQVAMKARRLGAAKAIIVSNQALTANALRTAKEQSIDVRTLKELPEAFPKTPGLWFSREAIRWSKECRISGKLSKSEGHPEDVYVQAYRFIDSSAMNAVYKIAGTETLLTRSQVAKLVRQSLGSVNFPPGVPMGIVRGELAGPKGPAYLAFGDLLLEFESLTVDIHGTVEELKPISSQSVRYDSESGKVNCHVLNNRYQEGDTEADFTILSEDEGKSFLINIPSDFMDENIRQEMPDGVVIKISIPDVGQPVIERVKPGPV